MNKKNIKITYGKSNNMPMRMLAYLSPIEYLESKQGEYEEQGFGGIGAIAPKISLIHFVQHD